MCSYYHKELNQNDVRVFWLNGNDVFAFYGYKSSYKTPKDELRESQKKIDDFISKLEDNYYQWANVYLDYVFERLIADDLSYCDSELEPALNPDTGEPCTACWTCRIEPIICPEHGYQQKTCVDNCCNQEKKQETIYCSPGICSGCLVPRWLNSADNLCMPYGFRFEQQVSSQKELVERTEEETLGEIAVEGDVSLKVLSDTKAVLTLYDRKGEGYSYNLVEGEKTEIKIPDWSEDIDTMILTPVDIHYTGDGDSSNYVKFSIYIKGFDNVAKTINAYCDMDGFIKQQKTKQGDGSWARCQNSFECESNLCSGGDCIEINDMIKQASAFKSLGIKVLCKMADLFGIEDYEKCLYGYLGG